MKVELIAYTPNPDYVCAVASQTCVSHNIPKDGLVALASLKHATASGHESVTEHASFSFAISGVSRALTHQLVRHRLASYSQQSQRYVDMNEFEYVTPASMDGRVIVEYDFFRNRNGYVPIREMFADIMENLRRYYKRMIDAGIPEEDARYILPNATCTNIVVSVNARELRHMAEERMCARAQWEIRELVTKMVELAKEVAPTLFEGVGARCEQLGYCPEQKGCGKYPKKS